MTSSKSNDQGANEAYTNEQLIHELFEEQLAGIPAAQTVLQEGEPLSCADSDRTPPS